MNIELDHLFICSKVNAPEMDRLVNLGLTEGRSNTHPGQGTANRCIFFQNFMLELLWLRDEAEVSSPTVAPTHLKERCNYQQTGYSPFGIGFRRSNAEANLPFKSWAYKPDYLPAELQIDIAQHTKPNEPLLFVIPFKKKTNEINHNAGMKKVSKIQVTIPSNEPFSDAVNAIGQQGLIKFIKGAENSLTIEFDNAIRQQKADFQPHLPLIFRW